MVLTSLCICGNYIYSYLGGRLMKDYENKANDSNLNIKLPKELREDFKNYCHQNSLNISSMIRKYMVRVLQEGDK